MRPYHQKPRLFLAGIIALLAVLSACDLAMPRRIEVNAALSLSVPVGDIGKAPEVQDAREYIKTENIAEIFDDKKAYVYYYYAERGYEGNEKSGYVIPRPDDDNKNENAEAPSYDVTNALRSDEVRTMLIHFPLAGVNLDFTAYLKTEVEMPYVVLPDISTHFPSLEPGADIPGEGFFVKPIPLDVMNEWIEYIDLNDTSANSMTTVTLMGGAKLAETLMLAIPELGIGDESADFENPDTRDQDHYATGKVKGDDLVFTASYETRLEPEKVKELTVYPLLVQVPAESGGAFKIDLDLQWTKAKVMPEQGEYTDTVRFPLKKMSDILVKYQLVTLPSYLYVGGPFSEENEAEIGLSIGGDARRGETITDSYNFRELYKSLAEGKTTYNGPLSYASTASFNLAGRVNKSNADDLILGYRMKLRDDSWVITPDTIKENGVITVDLVVLLPMEVEVLESVETLTQIQGQSYIRIVETADFGVDGDLFCRDQLEGAESRISSIRISGTTLKNTIYNGEIFLRIYDGPFDELHRIDMNKDTFSIDIAGGHIPMPFLPAFGVYIKKPGEPAGKKPSVRIKPKEYEEDDDFSMRISVEVAGEATYEQDL
jgi:hypothetical protein